MKLFNLMENELQFLKEKLVENQSLTNGFIPRGASCIHCESVCASGCGANCSGRSRS
jgi:hypothetical protein